MFMFRKKKAPPATSIALGKEAKKFQAAIAEVNAKYVPDIINRDILKGVADKYGVDVEFIVGSFESYLKRNAIREIRRLKVSEDYTIMALEQAAESFGFELDELGVTYFSTN